MWELLTGEEPYANKRSEEIIGTIHFEILDGYVLVDLSLGRSDLVLFLNFVWHLFFFFDFVYVAHKLYTNGRWEQNNYIVVLQIY